MPSLNPLKPAIALLATAPWVPWLLLASGFITPLTPAFAQQRLPNPRIFQELPPPSSSPVPAFDFPPPSSPPASPPLDREVLFQAPNPPLQPTTPTQTVNRYRVDIYGDTPGLLAQVQQIAPEAFVRQGEGVIQVGVFADQYNALLLVRALEDQGMQARVTSIPAGANNVDTVNPERLARASGYFVIIPGDDEDLPDLAAKVINLGVGQNAVSQRDAPRGSHIAVGPFKQRGDAERWSSYLRSVGMDARVYFSR